MRHVVTRWGFPPASSSLQGMLQADLEGELVQAGQGPFQPAAAAASVALTVRESEEGQVRHDGHVPHADVQAGLRPHLPCRGK